MFHSVELRAYCHATEEETRVEGAMRCLSPWGVLQMKRSEGHHGNPIVLITCHLEDSGEIAKFWRRLKEAGAIPEIVETLQERIDDEGVLHLRFDKQKAFAGSIDLARLDDVVAVQAKVAAYPAKKSNAVKVAFRYLQEV